MKQGPLQIPVDLAQYIAERHRNDRRQFLAHRRDGAHEDERQGGEQKTGFSRGPPIRPFSSDHHRQSDVDTD
ncbi:hypothetical protein D1872_268650 [compost metagenome]